MNPQRILLALIMLCGVCSQAQSTYVPDNNFEQALIDLGYDDVLDDQRRRLAALR